LGAKAAERPCEINVRFARKRTRLDDLRECAKARSPRFASTSHTENPVGGGMKKSNKYNARIVRDYAY
jgi:hypothetical protein